MKEPVPYLVASYSELQLLQENRNIETWEGKGSQGHHLIKVQPGGPARFKAEYEFLSSLVHPGFPKAIFYDFNSELEIYSREYVEGRPLKDYFGYVEPEEFSRLASQILRAVAALHFRGMAHGDLSASNILVNSSRRATLIDFEFLSPRHKPVENIHGTPHTMAPELFWGNPPTIQTDLYAIGCLFYALIAGHYPFQAQSFADLLQQHALEIPPDPTASRPAFPQNLGLVVLRLLAKEPGSRFTEANDVIQALNQALHQKEDLEPSPPHTTWQERLKVAQVHSMEHLAIQYLTGQKSRTPQEDATLAELLLKAGQLEELQKFLPQLSPELEWLYQGLLFNHLGNYEAALKNFQLKKIPKNTRALLGFATAQYYTGHTDQALKTLDEVPNNDNSKSRGVLANFKGNLYFYERRLPEAQQAFTFALEEARRAGAVALEALVSMNLANAQMALRDWGEALENYQRGAELYEGLGLHLEKIKTELNLSGLLRWIGHLEKAEMLVERAEKQLGQTSNLQLQSYANLLRADLAKKQGRWEEALEKLNTAQRFLKKNPSASDEGDLHISFGEVYFQLRRDEEMGAALRSAQVLAERCSDALLKARAEFLFMLQEGIRKKNIQPEPLYFLAEKLCSQGDLEFILDNLRRGQERSLREGITWPEPLHHWARNLGEVVLAKLPEDYRSFFRHHYADLWEESMMKTEIPSAEIPRSEEPLLQSILDWVKDLTGELNLQELTPKILDRMLQFTKMERGFVILKEGESMTVLQSHLIRPDDFQAEGKEALSWSLTRQAMEQGRPLATTNAQGDERLVEARSVHALNLRSILVLPFQFDGEVLGAVYLDSRLKAEHLARNDLPYLSGLADILGLAIHNAKTFEKTEQDLFQTQKALERSRKELEIKYRYENLIGRCEVTRQFLQRVDKVTEVRVPVLLLGESGSGKELVARAIHYNGPLRKGPFVAANCSAIPETLVESELFGHERGAFTGALQTRTGLFELAHQGTLFLDEIGDMPLPMQAKLLRFLQDGEVRRVGGSQLRQTRVRVLAATHRNLSEEIQQGRFREDLFYRLSVAQIHIPPLRERREDIPLLVDHFLQKFSEQNRVAKKRMDRKALSILMEYQWPGNIRELENLIYNLCIFSEGKSLQVEDLRQKPELAKWLKREEKSSTPIGSHGELREAIDRGRLNLSEAKRRFEREEIVRVLSLHQGKVGAAAEHLGIPRPQLSRLLQYHQIARTHGRD